MHKMVSWVRAMPRPSTLAAPLGGGGRQPCTGLLVVLPLARKSPVRAPHPPIRPSTYRPTVESELGGPLAVLGKLWDRSAGRSLASWLPPSKSAKSVSLCFTLFHKLKHILVTAATFAKLLCF